MTCTLILTRHAKSAWDSTAPSDHARPLNNRGRHSATALGHWLREMGHLPDQVISSPSQRTRETFERMQLQSPAVFVERLYHASAEIIFQVLSEAERPCTMILGHNPGIGSFARAIAHEVPEHPRFFNYPTGATLVLEFDIARWGDLQWGSGKLVDFAIPRDLLVI
ncbi:SixA phosphatase family protein [Parasedimentitalea psychrophila]|uniref:Histidine phosphatase family protein n=1 Tax=Parasedimentitalea psychrophila TaxID=2997337 RepID=A0A9Y2P4U8_9RHOB|nr:histidine phosphatase family protein [Parasedimentitalea psychrophila]WIY27302.1 histidine phosphatase family protein [Parasedimentitalea psychrophila]